MSRNSVAFGRDRLARIVLLKRMEKSIITDFLRPILPIEAMSIVNFALIPLLEWSNDFVAILKFLTTNRRLVTCKGLLEIRCNLIKFSLFIDYGKPTVVFNELYHYF